MGDRKHYSVFRSTRAPSEFWHARTCERLLHLSKIWLVDLQIRIYVIIP
jgi:hypothetical protein